MAQTLHLKFIFYYVTLVTLVHGYLLPQNVHLAQDLPKLAQFGKNGKSMVLVGGNLWDNNTQIYNTIVKMAGGPGVAKLGVIEAATADPSGGYQYYHDLLVQFGAQQVTRIPIDLEHTDGSSMQGTIDLIYNQTGFFFGGGDQARVIQRFLGIYGDFSPALIALHQMFDRGAVIAGTSAGCTCQTANYMVKSGVSYDALKYPAFADVSRVDGKEDPLIYASFGGLGFMKGFVLDSHFSQRGREGRMIRLLSDTQSLARGTGRGIGVDENTALVVTHADTDHASATVIGAGGVSIFDVSKSTVTTTGHFRIAGVKMSYLTNGDQLRLQDLAVTFSSSKTPMAGHEQYDDVLTTDDVFYGGSSNSARKPSFVRIATSVFDSRGARATYGTTHETSPRFRVELFGNSSSSAGWVERKHSFHSDITSYTNLIVNIHEG